MNSAPKQQQMPEKILTKDIELGLQYVGQVVERLDQHLHASSRLVNNVAATQERMPEMVRQISAAAAANRDVQEALSHHLKQRDEANRALMQQIDRMNDNIADQREQYRHQLALVMRLQRGGKRLLSLALLLFFVLFMALLALVLVMALRPDLLGFSSFRQNQTPVAANTAPAQALTAGQPTLAGQPILSSTGQTGTPTDFSLSSKQSELKAAQQSDNELIREQAQAILSEQGTLP